MYTFSPNITIGNLETSFAWRDIGYSNYSTFNSSDNLVKALRDISVYIILGNHPHTLEPMNKRTVTILDGSKKDYFVVYALGIFICDQNASNTCNSIILKSFVLLVIKILLLVKLNMNI